VAAAALAALPAHRPPLRARAPRYGLAGALALLCAGGAAAGTVPEHFAREQLVLVVAPHPDDESLCCAGVIQRARADGARVAIVWLTSGDAFELDAIVVEHRMRPGKTGLARLALERMAEARAAAGLLGVGADGQFFLGYPDRGLQRLLGDRYYSSLRSHYTGSDSVPYANALAPGSAYQGRNLERDLGTLLDRLQPTLVLAPTPLDAHPDHRAAGELVMRLMGARGALAHVAWWLVHTTHHLPGVRHWPAPRGLHPELALSPPPRRAALKWRSWELSDAERAGKERALRAHRTQMEVMAPFLLSFVRRNELYAEEPLPSEPEVPALGP
jgi:LmbE family N-acetylglucosaminyl deacetylase